MPPKAPTVQRGPRIGGYVAAARQAAIEIATNPSFRARIPVEGLFPGIRAVVRTAAQRGDVLHIEFRTEIYQQPQLSCTPTGRIARIERDGTVRYEESCIVVGHTPVNVTPDPVDIPTPLARGISAGVHLEALASSSGPLAYPIHARPAAEADDAAAYGIVFGR
jgi:hypothetical protein